MNDTSQSGGKLRFPESGGPDQSGPETGPHVVIVGAGFGGLNAAQALRHASVQVTVVDRKNHHLFQPLLYQVATAGLSPGDIAAPIRAVLARQSNVRVWLAEVIGIDLEARKVLLQDGEPDSGELGYDFLILATGARHAYFGHEEWEELAPGLKTLEDALEIRRRILLAFERAERENDAGRRQELMTFAVVGGGPTGVELAGAIAEIAFQAMARDFRAINPREARVILIEAATRILLAFPEDLSSKAEESLKRLRVEVWKNSPVTSVEPGRVVAGGRELRAATVLWAAGVAASPLARTLGVQLDGAGRVIAEPDLSIPGHPEVFVIGDLAGFLHQTGNPLPGVAPVAIQQGRHAARNIVMRLEGRPPAPFRYRDRGSLATIGRAAAVADLPFDFGLPVRQPGSGHPERSRGVGRIRFSGFFAWVVWLTVHIFWLIGFRNRFVVLIDWAWAYLTYQRSARLITRDMAKI